MRSVTRDEMNDYRLHSSIRPLIISTTKEHMLLIFIVYLVITNYECSIVLLHSYSSQCTHKSYTINQILYHKSWLDNTSQVFAEVGFATFGMWVKNILILIAFCCHPCGRSSFRTEVLSIKWRIPCRRRVSTRFIAWFNDVILTLCTLTRKPKITTILGGFK